MKPFEVPPLPYAYDALEPIISRETMLVHHDKHHAAYAKKLNELLEERGDRYSSLMDILKKSSGPLYNNAAQFYNHCFFWKCLSPKKDIPLPTTLSAALEKSFGSLDLFYSEFQEKGEKHFGSGWLWIVERFPKKLEIWVGHDADTPFVHSLKPLLACDVWDHAYYLDYKNERGKYLKNFLKVANWNFALENFNSQEFFRP